MINKIKLMECGSARKWLWIYCCRCWLVRWLVAPYQKTANRKSACKCLRHIASKAMVAICEIGLLVQSSTKNVTALKHNCSANGISGNVFWIEEQKLIENDNLTLVFLLLGDAQKRVLSFYNSIYIFCKKLLVFSFSNSFL